MSKPGARDANAYRTAQEALWWKFGATDSQVKEPVRFFYGRPNAMVINLGNVLYGDVLQEQAIEPYLAAMNAAGATAINLLQGLSVTVSPRGKETPR